MHFAPICCFDSWWWHATFDRAFTVGIGGQNFGAVRISAILAKLLHLNIALAVHQFEAAARKPFVFRLPVTQVWSDSGMLSAVTDVQFAALLSSAVKGSYREVWVGYFRFKFHFRTTKVRGQGGQLLLLLARLL